MSAYDNVICEKLKLKGDKALDVKSNKKKHKGGEALPETNNRIDEGGEDGSERAAPNINDFMTPAERRYLQQWEKIDRRRLEKMARKSHRDRIQEFNRYLANLTEHYDVPKVGPG